MSANFPGDLLGPPVGEVLFEMDGFVATRLGLFCPKPEDTTLPGWWRVGQHLGRLGSTFKFLVADYLRFGQWKHGEKFAQAQTLFPFWGEQTLMNIQRVGNRIPTTRRRALPFETQEAVASLPEKKQDEYLDRAEKKHLRREDVRDLVRAERERDDPEGSEDRYLSFAVERCMRQLDKAIERAGNGDVRTLLTKARNLVVDALNALEG